MKYDDIVEYLGQLGPYQKRVFLLACLPAITASIQSLTPVFILAIPNFRCAIPDHKNDTYKTQDTFHQSLINYTLPWNKKHHADDDDAESVWGHAECNVFKNRSASNYNHQWKGELDNKTRSCDRWVYNTDVFDNTFTTEADLVCENKVLRSHANMIFMVGVLVGSIFYGLLSDRFGRKTAFMSALLVHVVSTVALAFVHSFAFFAVLRFIIGTSCMGLFMCPFVIAVEYLGPKYRAQGSLFVHFYWCIGMFSLNVLAYYVRDWRHLQLIVSCYTVLFFLLHWVVPESPRWQISQGKIEQARVTMEKIAKSNGKELPKDAFSVDKNEDSEVKQGSLVDVFRSPVLSVRALIVFVNWLVVTMVYYGLTLNVGSLGGDIYVNFALSGITETLGNIVVFFALPRLGRKVTHCASMILGGTACLASMIPALMDTDVESWVILLLSNIGKFGATGGFSTIYVFTAELFPTYMRNSVVGTSSMVARLGGIAAPYIADLGVLVGGKFGTALPFVVFGACSVFAGLLALTLPDTLNMGIPETIEDAINFGKNKPNKEDAKTPVPKYTATVSNGTNQGLENINLGFQQ